MNPAPPHLVVEGLPRPHLYRCAHHLLEAARCLANGSEPALHGQVLELVATVRQLERESMDLMVGEDE